MNIHIDDIQAYLSCGMGYQLMKECKLPDQEFSSIDEKYIIELRRMVYFFFNQIKSHGYCDFKGIKKKWGQLWVGKRKKKDILIPTEDPVRGWYRKRERDGIDALFKIYTRFYDQDSEIIAVNMPYKIEVLPGINIVGKWPLIQVRDDKVEIYDFRRHADIGSLKRDITMTAMSLAYRTMFQSREDRLFIYSLDKDKTYTASRYDVDYKLLTDTVKEVVRAIRAGIFVRVMSKRCDDCPYMYFCKGV